MLAKRIFAVSIVLLLHMIGLAYLMAMPFLLFFFIEKWIYTVAIGVAILIAGHLVSNTYKEDMAWAARKLKWPIAIFWVVFAMMMIFGVIAGIMDIDLSPSK